MRMLTFMYTPAFIDHDNKAKCRIRAAAGPENDNIGMGFWFGNESQLVVSRGLESFPNADHPFRAFSCSHTTELNRDVHGTQTIYLRLASTVI